MHHPAHDIRVDITLSGRILLFQLSFVTELGKKSDSIKDDGKQSVCMEFYFMKCVHRESALEMMGKTLLDAQKC